VNLFKVEFFKVQNNLFHPDPVTYLQKSTTSSGQSWMCVLCGKQSNHLQNGKRHVKFVHMKASEEVECPVCNKMFGRKQVMDRHMKNAHPLHSQDFIMDQYFNQ